MNKNEFNRMISLADEKYVDEIFEDRLSGKRKNIFVTFTAAAAALAVILGAGFIAANTVRSPDISETMPSGFTAATPDDILIDEAFDYSRFFENKITEQEVERLYKEEIIVGGSSDKKTDFGNDATRKAMPFDTSIFNSTSSTFFYDLEDNVEFISIHLGKNMSVSDDIEQLKMCDIVVFRESELFSKLNLENYFPVQRYGVGVYGFETNTSKGDNKAAIFCANGSEYMISGGQSMTYDEMGTIIDAVISNGISANSFDLSAGYGYDIVTENISLAEANTVEPFEGHIPQSEIFSLERSVSYLTFRENDEIVSQLMILTFTNPSGGYIDLNYYTNSEMNPYSYDRIISIWDITPEAISAFYDNEEYNFTLICDGFMINVTAKCAADELWEYVSTINGGTSGNFDFSAFGTLAEANKLEHFAGYVPTVKEIGDMKISTENGSEVAVADSEEYGRVLNICYQSEVTSGDVYGGSDFKAIALTYTEKKEYNIPEAPIVHFEDILFADLDAYKTDGIRGGGRSCYRFVIDCGTCFITVAADCTPDEMQTYITSLVIDNEFGNKVTAEEEELKRRQEEEAEEERKRTEEEAKKAESLVNARLISLEKLKELAEKGGELMWDDFDGYDFEDVGSGLCIRVYGVEGGYTVMVGGGSLKEKPMYVYLDGNGKRIDMRYESIDGILN